MTDTTKKTFQEDDCLLLVDGRWGQYVGQTLAERYGDRLDLSVETLASLLAGPEDDLYLESWDEALNSTIADDLGNRYYLAAGEDATIFAIPEGMELPEMF